MELPVLDSRLLDSVKANKIIAEGNQENIPGFIEEKYKKYLIERRQDIIRCLSQVDKVCSQLEKREVISERFKNNILSRPMSQQKAEALVAKLMEISFKYIRVVIKVMYDTQHVLAGEQFKAIRKEIYAKETFNRDLVMNPRTVSRTEKIEDERKGSHEIHQEPLSPDWPSFRSHSLPTNSVRFQQYMEGDSDIDKANETARKLSLPRFFASSGVMSLMPTTANAVHGGQFFDISKNTNPPVKRKAREIIQKEYIFSFETALKEINNIPDLIDENPEDHKTSLHVLLHVFEESDCPRAINILLARFEEIQASEAELRRGDTVVIAGRSTVKGRSEKQDDIDTSLLAEFLNHEDKDGETVLHLAIRFRDVLSIRLLYRTYGANIFIKDKNGQTALELMYLHLPEEIKLILDSAITPCAKSYTTGKLIIGADFSAVLEDAPKIMKKDSDSESGKLGSVNVNNKAFKRNELSFLANVVNTSYKRQKIYLMHPLIELFLMIQWRRYKNWILASAILQFAFKILYGILVVDVFLKTCAYDKWPTELENPNTSATNNKSSLSRLQACYPCEIDSPWKILTGILAFFAGFLLLHEVVELYYKIKAALEIEKKKKKGGSTVVAIFLGLKNYFSELENVVQILSDTLMLYVCIDVLLGKLHAYDFSIASASVILGSILILIELGSFPWFSVYIQILFKVTHSFVKFLALYAVMIVAFAITFSITFPGEKSFKNVFSSISRTIIMMSGELDYMGAVYNEGREKILLVGQGQIAIVCFVIVMAFILSNLLIGLVVSDVKELAEKAKVVAMSVRLERCYTMAHTLRRRYWRWTLLPLKKVVGFLFMVEYRLRHLNGGDTCDLDGERRRFKLEPWHSIPGRTRSSMELGPNSRIAMLRIPEKLQERLEQLIKRGPRKE